MTGVTAIMAGIAGGSTIIASSTSPYALSFNPFPAVAGIRYLAAGQYESLVNSVPTTEGDWVSPLSAASNWEIRATVTSGVTPSGTVNTWLALTSDRTWELIQSVVGTSTSTLTFEFRRVGGSAAEYTVAGNVLTAEVA